MSENDTPSVVPPTNIWAIVLPLLTGAGLLLSLVLWPTAALSAPPGQSGPRPTVEFTPTSAPGNGGLGGPSTAADSIRPPGDTCANAQGQVLLWGAGGMGDVSLQLDGGSWQVYRVSASDGRYDFGALGEGVGILRVRLGEEASKSLQPMINNAAVPLTCDHPPRVNVGIYSGSRRPQPPGEIWMQADSSTLVPGGTITYRLLVRNALPTDLSQAIVTDLLPDGMRLLEVDSSAGRVEVSEGQLVTVYLGDMASGAEERIDIKARIWRGLQPGKKVLNSAALFYAESAADQAWLNLPVGGLEAVAVTAEEAQAGETAATEAPGVAAEEEPAVASSDEPAVEATPGAVAETSTEAAEAQEAEPAGLPPTGFNLTFGLPALLLAGIVMLLLAQGFIAIADSPERD
jgi:uncharacterized repeat protein (TIGR01451 family)